jgi:hypothetical protein
MWFTLNNLAYFCRPPMTEIACKTSPVNVSLPRLNRSAKWRGARFGGKHSGTVREVLSLEHSLRETLRALVRGGPADHDRGSLGI